MKNTHHLNFGPACLSRLYCRKCKEESIHKKGACIHCKTVFRGYKAREIKRLKVWSHDESKKTPPHFPEGMKP